MANEKTPVVWDDTTKKHRPLGSGEKMGGLSASSMISSDSGNLLQQGSDGLMLVTGGSIADPRADNLLEESDNGKLQVTTERVVEWLGGHPQDAASIAEAVKVVSGDSGNVITAGTDKGAYLAKGAISLAVSTMTDAQKNQLADAISPRIASDIADGKTIVASGGKLMADLTNATAAQKKAIAQALAGDGLVANSSSGRLDVDFSQMDTTEFQKTMASLIDAQQLKTDGGANHFYVDGTNGSDANPETRGAPSRPFRSLQTCIDHITKIFKFGSVDAFVECRNVSLSHTLTLPSFDRTTAEITIRSVTFPASDADRANPTPKTTSDLTISVAPTGYSNRYAMSCLGTGVWNVRNFHLLSTDASLASFGGHLAALLVAGYSTVRTRYCTFETTRSSSMPWLARFTTGEHVVQVGDYGHLSIEGYNRIVGSDLSASMTISSGDNAGTYNRMLRGLSIGDSGSVQVEDTRDDAALVFSGNFVRLVSCSSLFTRNFAFMGISDTSGVANADYRFYFGSGGHASLSDPGLIDGDHNNDAATDTWLGSGEASRTNADGTTRKSYVQTSTYSWYD